MKITLPYEQKNLKKLIKQKEVLEEQKTKANFCADRLNRNLIIYIPINIIFLSILMNAGILFFMDAQVLNLPMLGVETNFAYFLTSGLLIFVGMTINLHYLSYLEKLNRFDNQNPYIFNGPIIGRFVDLIFFYIIPLITFGMFAFKSRFTESADPIFIISITMVFYLFARLLIDVFIEKIHDISSFTLLITCIFFIFLLITRFDTFRNINVVISKNDNIHSKTILNNNFSGYIFDNVSFYKTVLSHSSFSGSIIKNSIFKKSDISNVNFNNAKIVNTVIDSSNLSGVSFNKTTIIDVEFIQINNFSCDNLSKSNTHGKVVANGQSCIGLNWPNNRHLK